MRPNGFFLKTVFPVATCKKVYGRGAKKADYSLIEGMLNAEVSAPKEALETISESHRLIAKRLLMLVVKDDEVDEVVKLIIETNQTGNMGDGKIFVMPVKRRNPRTHRSNRRRGRLRMDERSGYERFK